MVSQKCLILQENTFAWKRSFGAREAKYLKLFGLEGKVKLANVELNNAVPALKNRQIDGFVTAGSYPAPNVIEATQEQGSQCFR